VKISARRWRPEPEWSSPIDSAIAIIASLLEFDIEITIFHKFRVNLNIYSLGGVQGQEMKPPIDSATRIYGMKKIRL
jgi:hypothetical protein